MQTEPIEDWGLIRERQADVLELPKTGVATAVDVGQADNVHFWNKKPVGIRLARLALVNDYGMAKSFDSAGCPELEDFKIEGDKVYLKIRHAGKGLKLREGLDKPQGFAICAQDGKWVWADSVKLDKDVITVSDSKIKKPKAVRYAWAQNPYTSVENSDGFALRPLRTDKDSEF